MTTLIVEDGTVVANANTYVDIEFVNSEAELIPSLAWDNNSSLQAIALVNAARFLDWRYSTRVTGVRDSQQSLYWPVNGQVPRQVKLAQARLAVRFIEDSGFQYIQPQAVQSTSVSISGAVSESTSYFAPTNTSVYAEIDAIMAPLFNVTSTTKLIRS